jgi:hypothetical protein
VRWLLRLAARAVTASRVSRFSGAARLAFRQIGLSSHSNPSPMFPTRFVCAAAMKRFEAGRHYLEERTVSEMGKTRIGASNR